MKRLRALILIDAGLLTALGLGMALFHPFPLPVAYAAAEPYQAMATVRLLGTALGGAAMVLWAASGLSLLGDFRRLARWLSAANVLVAVMALAQQTAIWGTTVGWSLVLVPLILAGGLAWEGLRPLRPGEMSADLAALRLPEETRAALLRQLGEAAAQEERNRLARDLHDSIKQQLFTINVSGAAAQELWDGNPQRAKAALGDVRRSAREAMVEMQALLHQLQPRALASAGLVEALREQCEALGYRTGAEVALELGEAIPDERLPPGAQETLFRIAQEALANVARHARARRVRVWLGREGDWARLRVEDDGQGFDPAAAASGMGLRNLRERAESLRGTLEAQSTPGAGATISVRVPLSPVPLRLPPIENALLAVRHNLLGSLLPALLFWLQRPIVSEKLSYLDLGFAIIWVVLIIPSAVVDVRRRARYALEAAPDAAPAATSLLCFRTHRNRIVLFLAATWWAPWWWRFEHVTWGRIWSIAWLVASLVWAGLTITELIRLHRGSELRTHFTHEQWRRIGLALILCIPILLLRLWSRPRPLAPAEVLYLLLGAAVLGYLLMRQPRTEGAAA